MRGTNGRRKPADVLGAQPVRVRPGPDREGGGRHRGRRRRGRGADVVQEEIVVPVQEVLHLQPGGLRAEGGQVRHQVPQVQKSESDAGAPPHAGNAADL